MDFSTKVVSTSRKRAGAKVNRYDAINVNNEAPKIFDAGGGSGYVGLTAEVMQQTQLDMYKRHVLSTNALLEENVKQEVRQTKIVTQYNEIVVNVRREDFPSISADIPVRYTNEALQAAWGQFVFDLRVALSVEFVDSIIDRKDMAPVNRILGLRDGGQYFVRQREESAILEVIQSGNNPEQTSWVVTESINIAKVRLRDSGVAQTKMDAKVDEILLRPTLREQQREITYRILEAEDSKEIIEAMWDVLNAIDLPPAEYAAAMTLKMKHEAEVKRKEDERTARLAYLVAHGGSAKEILELSKSAQAGATGSKNSFDEISTKTFDPEVDIVGLYRLSFEQLGRLLVKFPEKASTIATDSFKFVEDTMTKFRDEVDICVLGSKLLSDLSSDLIPYRTEFYNVIMDNIQFYAPRNEDFRPPRIIRRKLTEAERKKADEEWEAQLHADKSGVVQLKDKDVLDVEVAVMGGGDEMVFDLEQYIAEQEAKKKKEAEEAAAAEEERRRLRLLAMQPPVEEVKEDMSLRKKVKKPWRGTKGFAGKLVPEEEEHKSMFDGMEDELNKPKKRVLKGFKVHQGSRPLPVVPGIKFRGLVGPYKKDMAMLQCFATLYKFVCASYGNRDKAFSVAMPEEVACIGLVSNGQTRILEYIMWIIDTVYSDGFSSEEGDMGDASIAPTMALSGSDEVSALADPKTTPNKNKKSETKGRGNDDKDKERKGDGIDGKAASIASDEGSDPLIGVDIDCASTISMPSIDVDGKNDRLHEDLIVNMGDMNIVYEDAFKFDPFAEADTRSANVTADLVLDPEDKERDVRYRDKALRQNAGLMEELGEELYSARYLARPRDPVVLFCAMISCHGDMQEREREMGRKWIGLWDDASARFKRLMVVGQGLSGLT